MHRQRKKLNCWEVKRCGREPGGDRVAESGICPAAIAIDRDGINAGTNAGRYCWRIAGTCCAGTPQGSFVDKVRDCGECVFFLSVLREEGPRFKL